MLAITKKAIIASITTAFISFSGMASSNEIEKKTVTPITGKAIFTKYGIADDIAKLGLSSLVQGEHLVEYTKRHVQVGDKISDSEAFLVQDTDEKGNIDLRIKYNPAKISEDEDVIEHIENNTRIEYRLRDYVQSYDAKSVTATELANGHVEISFNYSKYGLPQDIAYFRFMHVTIDVKDGQPLAMEITNSQPFTYDKYNIHHYLQKITFNTLASGKVLIENKNIQMNGETKKNKPFELTTEIVPIAYYEGEEITVLNEDLLLEASDPRMRESRVKLDGIFPLMGDMVRRQGIDIPLPYGVSVSYRKQDMDVGFNDFNVMGLHLNDFFDPKGSVGTVNAESVAIRGDLNILPFWNVYGVMGKVMVDANVNAEYTGEAGRLIRDKLNNKVEGLGNAFCNELSALCNKGNFDVPLHLDYDLLGVGTTLSVGYREFFASVTGTYSVTRLEGNAEWGDGILTVQPMLGYQLADYRTQLFIGAEYQGLKPSMSGEVSSVEIDGKPFFYDVGIDMSNWAYLVGFNKQFGKHYNATVLFNKGETRSAVTLNLGYRF